MRIPLSGCAIVNDKEELLLLWKIKHGHFEFPGGKVENGETLEQTAKREVKEELSVDITIKQYLGHVDFDIDNRQFRSHKYLGIVERDQTPRIGEPEVFSKLFWLPMRNFTSYNCAPNVKVFCQRYIDGKIVL